WPTRRANATTSFGMNISGFWAEPLAIAHLPLQPKLLSAAAAAAHAPFERAAALGNGHLARRLLDFLLLLVVARFFGLRDCRLQRQAHPLRFGIHVEHLALDLLSLFHDIFYLIDLVVRQLGDVNQSFHARRQLHEGAKLRDSRHGPCDG